MQGAVVYAIEEIQKSALFGGEWGGEGGGGCVQDARKTNFNFTAPCLSFVVHCSFLTETRYFIQYSLFSASYAYSLFNGTRHKNGGHE